MRNKTGAVECCVAILETELTITPKSLCSEEVGRHSIYIICRNNCSSWRMKSNRSM
jgi:hypothetical protein